MDFIRYCYDKIGSYTKETQILSIIQRMPFQDSRVPLTGKKSQEEMPEGSSWRCLLVNVASGEGKGSG